MPSASASPPAPAAGSRPSPTSPRSPRTSPRSRCWRPRSGTGGRNNYGRKTARHKGGGHKQQYRVIDFKRNKDGVPAKVAAIEYDPNRNCRIALLHYLDGEKRYILAPKGVKVGDLLQTARARRSGRATPCRCATSRSAPPCTTSSSSPARAASWPAAPGRACSSWPRRATSPPCACPAPRCAGADRLPRHRRRGRQRRGRADQDRQGRPQPLEGVKPQTRGVAMNPVDHPLGGGEGKTSGGRHPVSPWGKPEGRTRDKTSRPRAHRPPAPSRRSRR